MIVYATTHQVRSVSKNLMTSVMRGSNGNLTGYDHLKFICDVQKIPQTQIDLIAKQVGMATYMKKKVKNYSLGMKQHLLLAMTIINDPKILLMDEPLNGLDPTSAINMRNILLELYQKGTTIFLSSHNLDEIDRLTDTIYFMKDGRLLKESLHDLSSTHYLVTVNDLSKAERVLTESHLPFTVETESTIVFKEADVSLQTFIDCLNGKDITITDLKKRNLEQKIDTGSYLKGIDQYEADPLRA